MKGKTISTYTHYCFSSTLMEIHVSIHPSIDMCHWNWDYYLPLWILNGSMCIRCSNKWILMECLRWAEKLLSAIEWNGWEKCANYEMFWFKSLSIFGLLVAVYFWHLLVFFSFTRNCFTFTSKWNNNTSPLMPCENKNQCWTKYWIMMLGKKDAHTKSEMINNFPYAKWKKKASKVYSLTIIIIWHDISILRNFIHLLLSISLH